MHTGGVNDAFGRPQTVLVLGGSSDIATAILDELSGTMRQVVLAVRDPAMVDVSQVVGDDVDTSVISFDGADPASVAAAVDTAVDRLGDLDLTLVSYGVLGDHERARDDPDHAAEIAATNYLGPVGGLTRLGQVVRRQGHGTIVVLSSVAGERVRPGNYHYGASKAALDGFCQGMASDLSASGGRVLIVRPGFVHTKMTAGMDPAPFSTTPAKVASAVGAALGSNRRVIWVPAILRWVMVVLRHLPATVVDRLPR